MRHLRPPDLPVRPPQTTFLPSGFPLPGERASPLPRPSTIFSRAFQCPSPLSFLVVFGTTRRPRRATTACRARRRARRARARGRFPFQHRGPPGPFYLRHAPRLLPLNHLADKPGTGYHPGKKSPSPISSTLQKRSHVARGFLGPVVSLYVQASRPGAVSEPPPRARSISGGRHDKRPPTLQRKPFRVSARLFASSPASPWRAFHR